VHGVAAGAGHDPGTPVPSCTPAAGRPHTPACRLTCGAPCTAPPPRPLGTSTHAASHLDMSRERRDSLLERRVAAAPAAAVGSTSLGTTGRMACGLASGLVPALGAPPPAGGGTAAALAGVRGEGGWAALEGLASGVLRSMTWIMWLLRSPAGRQGPRGDQGAQVPHTHAQADTRARPQPRQPEISPPPLAGHVCPPGLKGTDRTYISLITSGAPPVAASTAAATCPGSRRGRGGQPGRAN